MSRNKMIIFGIIFLIAIILIVIGSLQSKNKQIDNGTISEAETYNEKGEGKVTEMTIPTTNELQKQREEIYNIQLGKDKDGNVVEKLEHPTVQYEMDIPRADLNKLVVEESSKNGVLSTNYYYQTKTVKAFVFGIHNYPMFDWDEYEGTNSDEILGKTDIRVVTVSYPLDNPFTEDSKEAKEYNELVQKAQTEYVKTFKFIQKETK